MKAWTNALSGSFRLTETKRVVGVTLPVSLRIVTASCTSAAVKGSSGCLMGVLMGINPVQMVAGEMEEM